MHKLLMVTAAAVALSAGVAVAQPGPGRGMAMLALADANHDGNITRAEFDDARARRFAQLDADHNGVLSASERPQWGGGPPPPAAGDGSSDHRPHGDANGDGSISRAEYDAQGARMFQRLDTDGNGVISQAELQAMQQHMQH
jgi:hypothetical protein